MAINFGAGFNIAKAEAVDTRIYLKTLADMLTIDENVYPEPIAPADADPELVQQVETDLQDFFTETLLEPGKRA